MNDLKTTRPIWIIKKIQKNPKPHKELANELGFSLGKLNYCLKALKKRSWKLQNFQNQSDKISYLQYIITQMYSWKNKAYNKFHEEKMSEYDELKKTKSINKMWTIIKVDLKNLEFLKNEFKKKVVGKIYHQNS